MFIHADQDWPAFRWDTASLAEPLATTRHRQGLLVGRLSALGLRLQSEAELTALTTEIVQSSAIEGERLPPDEVRSSIARRLGIAAGGAGENSRAVEGVVELMIDATQRYDEPLTDDRLFGWHSALFPSGRSGMRAIKVGEWRDDRSGPMQVVSGPMGSERVHFEAPPAARVATEMQRFLSWLNTKDGTDPVLRAGVAHLWFVTIHPFDDGNGRIARAITELMLARSDARKERFYSMSAQIQEERREYYTRLEHAQRGGLDITIWLDWFLRCLARSFERAELALDAVFLKARTWERANAFGVNDRQRLVLTRLMDAWEGNLTSTKYATIAKCSPDTALRDITILIDAGVLEKNARGGRSASYRLAE